MDCDLCVAGVPTSACEYLWMLYFSTYFSRACWILVKNSNNRHQIFANQNCNQLNVSQRTRLASAFLCLDKAYCLVVLEIRSLGSRCTAGHPVVHTWYEAQRYGSTAICRVPMRKRGNRNVCRANHWSRRSSAMSACPRPLARASHIEENCSTFSSFLI